MKSKKAFTVIGMIHLPPLLGYEKFRGMGGVVDAAKKDIEALEEAGFDGVLIENEYDQPHRVEARPETIASMAVVAQEAIRQTKRLKIGVEILLNDPIASLAVAKASGAHFIRTDYFVDRMARDEYGGEMKIDPSALLAYRKAIGGDQIEILADVQVKYARMLEKKTIARSSEEAREARADGVIISGNYTGHAPDPQSLREAQAAVGEFPVYIGSGLNIDNAKDLVPHCGGAIVGMGIMTGRRVDVKKAKKLMNAIREIRDE